MALRHDTIVPVEVKIVSMVTGIYPELFTRLLKTVR